MFMARRLKGFGKIIFLFLLNSSIAIAQEVLPGLNGDFIVFPEGAGFRFIDKGYSYFTEDGMKQLDEAAEKEFKYGNVHSEI